MLTAEHMRYTHTHIPILLNLWGGDDHDKVHLILMPTLQNSVGSRHVQFMLVPTTTGSKLKGAFHFW